MAQIIKKSPANAGNTGLIPGSGRAPGERNGNPLQYSCLGNPMDRGAWWATVCVATKENMTEQLTTRFPHRGCEYLPALCQLHDGRGRIQTPPGCVHKESGDWCFNLVGKANQT